VGIKRGSMERGLANKKAVSKATYVHQVLSDIENGKK